MAVNRDTSSFFRLVFFLVALIIIAASTWFSNDLGKELAAEEQKKIELWAEAIQPGPGTPARRRRCSFRLHPYS